MFLEGITDCLVVAIRLRRVDVVIAEAEGGPYRIRADVAAKLPGAQSERGHIVAC